MFIYQSNIFIKNKSEINNFWKIKENSAPGNPHQKEFQKIYFFVGQKINPDVTKVTDL